MRDPETYRQLEMRMLSYDDYKDVPVMPVNEPLVPILGSSALSANLIRDDARPVTGDRTFVRANVRDRLLDAAKRLDMISPGLTLDVGYGYRALSVQRERFLGALQMFDPSMGDEARRAAAHRLVAVPELAGHPAGPAVDIRIMEGEEPLDFGTQLWQFTEESYTFAPDISACAKANRMLLRDVMMGAGFAPFDGEWWHFSYGDREWARYYDHPAAIYEQVEFTTTDV